MKFPSRYDRIAGTRSRRFDLRRVALRGYAARNHEHGRDVHDSPGLLSRVGARSTAEAVTLAK